MAEVGLEPQDVIPFPCNKLRLQCLRGGTESGTVAEADPDLLRVIAAWPALPTPLKVAVLALVGTTEPARNPDSATRHFTFLAGVETD